MSRLDSFAALAISFAFAFCFSVSSLILASARAWAFEGTCGIPSGIMNGLALKLRNTLSIFSESSVPPSTSTAAFLPPPPVDRSYL